MFQRFALIAVFYTLGVLTAPRRVIDERRRLLTKLTKEKDALASDIRRK